MTKTQTWPRDILDALPESRQVECIEGALIVNPPPTWNHQVTVTRIRTWLTDQVGPARVLEGIGIDDGEGGWYIPDLVVVTADYRSRVKPDQSVQDANIVALAVEVASPSSLSRDRHQKRRFWERHGVPYILVEFPTVFEFGVDPADWDVEALTALLSGR
jgi:Uma2 family endonuclease